MSLKVALLVQTSSTWSREVLAGVGCYAQEQGGWEFLIEPRGFHERLLLPSHWHPDGVICRLTDSEVATSIESKRVPAVNVAWLGNDVASVSHVVSDESACAEMAADYYRRRGFLNFGYIGPPAALGYSPCVADCFANLVSTIPKSKLDVFPRYVEDLLDHQAELRIWLDRLRKPVGLFVWSTQIARVVIDAASELSLAIPDDIAVLALEHEQLLAALAPIGISSVQQNGHRVGYEAAQLLHRLMTGRAATRSTIKIQPLGIDERVSTDTRFNDDPLIREAIRYVRENAHQDIDVVAMAQSLGISRRSLEYRFRKAVRRTPAAEIRRVRLGHVKRLLAVTDMSVEQIAFSSGFNHPEAMIRMFKREMSQTPAVYRRQVQHR